MSTRERWIVYPLLFMTLGIALRDKIIPPAHLGNPWMQFEAGIIAAPRIRCNQLQVKEMLCERLESQQSACGTLLVPGPSGRPVVIVGADAETGAGVVETFTSLGIPQVRVFSDKTRGVVATFEAKKATSPPVKGPSAPEKQPEKQPKQKSALVPNADNR